MQSKVEKFIITMKKLMQKWHQIWHVLVHANKYNAMTMQVWYKLHYPPLRWNMCGEKLFSFQDKQHVTTILQQHDTTVLYCSRMIIPQIERSLILTSSWNYLSLVSNYRKLSPTLVAHKIIIKFRYKEKLEEF